MDAKLIVINGQNQGLLVKLHLPVVLGRGREAGITIGHPLVSRDHCQIYEKGGRLVVQDLGSLNGTYIDDARIIEGVLHPGALLTVGPVTFQAVYGDFQPAIESSEVKASDFDFARSAYGRDIGRIAPSHTGQRRNVSVKQRELHVGSAVARFVEDKKRE